MRISVGRSVVIGLGLLCGSCGRANPAGPSALTSADTLIAALRTQGATASLKETVLKALPCVSADARIVFVNDGTANAFEYPTSTAADRAAKISPDGSSVSGDGCAAQVTWIAPPHFYKRDHLIVVYAGTADSVLRPLETVLGKPFASR